MKVAGQIILSLFIIIVFLVLLGMNIFTILFGLGIYWGKTTDRGFGLRSFPRVTIGGWRAPMWSIVFTLYGLAALVCLLYLWPQARPVFVGLVILAVLAAVVAVVLILAYFAIKDGCRAVGRWDGVRLFLEYLKARKRRVCPLITFVKPDSLVSAEHRSTLHTPS